MALTPEQEALDFNPELQGLSRERKLAELLMAKGMQQPQGQMISGYYVAPSFTQQLNPLANALAGQAIGERADTKQAEMAAALRGKQQEVMKAWSEAKTPQEKFAIGTSQYAPKELQAATYEMLKPHNVAEGGSIQQMNLGTGAFEPIAQGNQKIAPEVRQAMQTLGINKPLEQLNPQELNAIRSEIYQVKRAAAPSVSVSMDKGLAAQVGPMMKESKEKTIGAVKEIDAANQVINAIDGNKMFAGPLANQRLTAAQIGSTLGVGGKDLPEKINNTRAAIQGLAEITLQGRQEMRGQGAITESEGKLAERAKSGDISLTPGELKQLANAAKRAGEYTYNQHQSQLQAMSQNNETRQLMPYYNVSMMPQKPQTFAQPSNVRSLADQILQGK